MSKPQFDRHAFEHRAEPVHAEYTREGWASTGIDWVDYGRMGIQTRKLSNERRLPTPDWAVNDKLLRKLIVTAMEERAGVKRHKGNMHARLALAQELIRTKRPKLFEALTRLCKIYVEVKGTHKFAAEESDANVMWLAQEMFGQRPLPNHLIAPDDDGTGAATARVWLKDRKVEDYEIEIEGLDTYLRYTEKDGGAGTMAAVVYLYYRAGMDSVGVAEELGLKPPHVRQILWRLNETYKAKFGAGEIAKDNQAAKPNRAVAPVHKPHTSKPSHGVLDPAPNLFSELYDK